MKYHSPFSTIVISVTIVLLFAAVSVFTVLFFGISSPTEVMIQEAISSLSSEDPNLSISYSSIDRRLSEGVTINDVKLNLHDRTLIDVDKVQVEKGIVSIFKEIFSDEMHLQLRIRNPKISITDEDIKAISEILGSSSNEAEEPATEIDVKDEKKKDKRMILDFDFQDLEFAYGDVCTIPDADALIRFDSAIGIANAEADIREADVDFNDIHFCLDNLKLRLLRAEDEYKLKLSLADTHFSVKDISAYLRAFALDTSFTMDTLKDPVHLPFKLGAEELEVENGDASMYLKSLPFSVTSDGSDAVAGFNQVYASFDRYAASLDSLSIGIDLVDESARLSVDRISGYQETVVLGRIDNFMASLKDKQVRIDLATISSTYTDKLTSGFIRDVFLSDIGIDLLPGENGGRVKLGANLIVGSHEQLLDGISSDIDVDVEIADKTLKGGKVVLGNIGNEYFKHKVTMTSSLKNGDIALDIDYGDRNLISIDYMNDLNFVLKLDEFHISETVPFLNVLLPQVASYITDDTILNGRLSFIATRDENSALGMTGPLDYAFALSGVNFNGMKFNVGSTLNSFIGKEKLDIESFILTSDYVKLRYKGNVSLEDYLPEGNLGLEMSETGKEIMNLMIQLNDDNNYAFDLEIPMLGETQLKGNLDFADGRFLSEATLSSFSTDYAFQLDLDLNARDFNLYNRNANVFVDWNEGIDAIASFDRFALPVGSENVEPCTLTGEINLDFDFSSQKYRSFTKNFHIDNMRHLPLDPSLVFSFDFEDGKIDVYDAVFSTSEFSEMTGTASIDLKTKEIAFVFKIAEELVQFSSIGIEDYYSGLFSVKDYNLQRLGLEDGIISLSLVGRGRDLNSLSFSGGFNVVGSDMINKPLEMRGEVYVNKDTLSITDLIYKKGSMTVTCPDILFSTTDGSLTIPLSLDIIKENKDRQYPISLDLQLSMEMEGQKDFYKLFSELSKDNFETIRFGIGIKDFNLDNTFMFDEKSSTFRLKDGSVIFDGSLVDGYVDLTRKYLDLDIDLLPIGAFSLRGEFAPEFDLSVNVKSFNVGSVNFLFPYPVVNFGTASIADGSVMISGKLGDIHMYGDVWADRLDVDVFWVPEDLLIAHNVHFVIWDNNMKTAMTAVTAVDRNTQERRAASVVCEFNFLPSFQFDYYQIDCYVPDGNEISFRLPLLKQNIDMKGLVSGWFIVHQEGANDVHMEGKANCDDFMVSIGLDKYPHWLAVNPDKKTSFDFDLLLRDNFKFVYPLGPNPIITAFAAENQNLNLTLDKAKGFGASGSIGLRAGEIYYFQKNFLITEGNIELRDSDTFMIDPHINLRAQLRDFDQNGDKVDIYLVLRDASLTNFNPTFESSPAKDISEIMSILGQSIISTENTGNLSSIVHLVSTGVDVLNRIGYLSMGSETDSFRKSIRTSLNLDTFSLHTNIIENLVFDAVGLVQNSMDRGVSPLASYLDGTTLYMGKYLTTDIYLGAMVHLAADRSGGLESPKSSFLTSDLALDTEISIEWDNPLCNFRFFTRPSSINAFEIFDTMGFSLSRRFVF